MNAFVQTILNALQKEKLNKRKAESIALKHGITDKTLIKEFIELAIVLKAGEIANNSLTISEKFTEIVNLYQNQVSLSHRTSQSIMLQQYSTPAPISYLAGVYVLHNQPKDYHIFEPSAGNGLLTIAFNPRQVIVNEVDDNRYNNLKTQDFIEVMRVDATRNLALEHNFTSFFEGVITNPPFGTLDEPLKIGEYKINHLDHAMAIRALDCMKDTGRASIIIGGHTNYDDKGRVQSGKNRIFLSYLYSHYNVEDIINIDGSLYSRQGTSFDVRLILINGRKAKPEGFPPLKTDDSEPIKDFDSLFDRVVLNLSNDAMKIKIAKAKAKALQLLQMQGGLNGVDSRDFNKQIIKYKRGLLSAKTQLRVCETPKKLIVKGLPEGIIVLNQSVIKKAIGKHNLLWDHFLNLPEKISNPKAVYKSKSISDAFVVLIEQFDLQLKPVVVAIHVIPKRGKIVIENIASIYGKDIRQLKKWEEQNLKI